MRILFALVFFISIFVVSRYRCVKFLQAAKHIGAAVSCNGVNPGAGCCLVGVKSSGFLPNLEHYFLHQLVGIIGRQGRTGQSEGLHQWGEVPEKSTKSCSILILGNKSKTLTPLIRAPLRRLSSSYARIVCHQQHSLSYCSFMSIRATW